MIYKDCGPATVYFDVFDVPVLSFLMRACHYLGDRTLLCYLHDSVNLKSM